MGMPAPLRSDANFWWGLAITGMGWLLLFYVAGLYSDVVRTARLQALGVNLALGVAGSIVVFLVLFLDDLVPDYRWYYYHLALYGAAFLTFSSGGRFFLLSLAHQRVQDGRLGFPAVLLMPEEEALQWYETLTQKGRKAGHLLLGFFSPENTGGNGLLPKLGRWDETASFVLNNRVEEVILSPALRQDPEVVKLYPAPVRLRMVPDQQELLTGSVRQTALFGALLADLVPLPMPHWQKVLKRFMDIMVSLSVLVLLGPFMLFIAWLVRRDGHPALFTQERIGLNGRSFRILKFRTMRPDAEASGPALSRENDPRITPIGRFLRKYRLDELPQFINVLKGDMSLVGPRPEREHFISLITAIAPHYLFLHRVRPGITSWGMVMFGYASSVPEMLQRMRYDILYLENMSLALDMRILIYTLRTVWRGEGQ